MGARSFVGTSLQDLERAGLGDGNVKCEIFSLQEEITYLARIGVPSKNELHRLQAKFNLGDETQAVKNPPTARTVAPVPSSRIKGAVLRLPAHQPVVMAEVVEPAPEPKRGFDRERVLWDRYCVECDTLLEQRGPRYVCPNLNCNLIDRKVYAGRDDCARVRNFGN